MKKNFIFRHMAILLAFSLFMVLPAFAAGPKPGSTPDVVHTMDLVLNVMYVFPSPFSSASAGIRNPDRSDKIVKYKLCITASELLSKSGRQGDNIDTWPQSEQTDAFAADERPIVLWESDYLYPGGNIEQIALNPLPDGTTMTEGIYNAVMIVECSDPSDSTKLLGVFHVDVAVNIMVGELEMDCSIDGQIRQPIFNSSDSPATFVLAIADSDLQQKTGTYQAENTFLSAHNTLIPVLVTAQTPALEAVSGAYLSLLPNGESLHEGTYTAWLMRMQDDKAPYACARVQLTVPEGLEPIGQRLAIDHELLMQFAQAAVDGEYLFSFK